MSDSIPTAFDASFDSLACVCCNQRRKIRPASLRSLFIRKQFHQLRADQDTSLGRVASQEGIGGFLRSTLIATLSVTGEFMTVRGLDDADRADRLMTEKSPLCVALGEVNAICSRAP